MTRLELVDVNDAYGLGFADLVFAVTEWCSDGRAPPLTSSSDDSKVRA